MGEKGAKESAKVSKARTSVLTASAASSFVLSLVGSSRPPFMWSGPPVLSIICPPVRGSFPIWHRAAGESYVEALLVTTFVW